MSPITKRIPQAVAAIAIPLCVEMVWLVLFGLPQALLRDVLRLSTLPDPFDSLFFDGLKLTSVIAGFAVIVRALRPRWVILIVVGVVYFRFMWWLLLYYSLFVAAMVTQITCSDPRPGACWP